MSIKLSLCIPTYNRAKFIGETVESIISQATDEVEIVVSDNASNDNTQEIVARLQLQFPLITYFRWDYNVGADRNFLKVVELAQGEYCWLMGSDDRIEKQAITCVLAALRQYPGVVGLSVNEQVYDVTMKQKKPASASPKIDCDYLFTDVHSFVSKMWPYVGYISSQIVNKYEWGQAVASADVSNYFNAYVHVYVIGRMLLANPRWLYVHQKCVGHRAGNDSFLETEGRYNRLAIDVLGFEKIAKGLFGKKSRLYHMSNKITSMYQVRFSIISAKVNGESPAFLRKAFLLCIKVYWRYLTFWALTVPLFLMPRSLIILARQVVINRKLSQMKITNVLDYSNSKEGEGLV